MFREFPFLFVAITSITMFAGVIASDCQAQNQNIDAGALAVRNSDDANPDAPASKFNLVHGVIGLGYDSTLGQLVRTKCAELKPNEALGKEAAGDPQTIFRLERILDQRDYLSKTNTTISAAYDGGAAGAGAHARYFTSSKLNSYSSYAFIETTVEYPEKSFTTEKFDLTDFGRKIFNLGAAAFRATCGDKLVVGYQRGGQFTAVVNILSTSTEQQIRDNQSIESWSKNAKGKITLTQDMVGLEKSGFLTIDIVRNGLEEDMPGLDLDKLVKYANEFPAKIANRKDKPITKLIMADYIQILLAAAMDSPAQASPKWIDLVAKKFNYFRSLNLYRGNLIYIAEHIDQFVSFDQRYLSPQIERVGVAIDDFLMWYHNCIKSRGEVCPPEIDTAIAVPDVAPIRASAWSDKFDPRSSAEQPIGETPKGEPMVLELRGYWIYHDDPKHLSPVTNSTQVIVIDKQNAARKEVRKSQISQIIPANCLVFFKFIEQRPNWYSDNYRYAPDPVKARLGGSIEEYVR